MKQIVLFLTMLFMALSISSCSKDDPEPIEWTITNYDEDNLKVTISPAPANDVYLYTGSNFSGHILLHSVNYDIVGINGTNISDMWLFLQQGVSISKLDDHTLEIIFSPIEEFDPDHNSLSVTVTGIKGNERNTSEISVLRYRELGN